MSFTSGISNAEISLFSIKIKEVLEENFHNAKGSSLMHRLDLKGP